MHAADWLDKENENCSIDYNPDGGPGGKQNQTKLCNRTVDLFTEDQSDSFVCQDVTKEREGCNKDLTKDDGQRTQAA